MTFEFLSISSVWLAPASGLVRGHCSIPSARQRSTRGKIAWCLEDLPLRDCRRGSYHSRRRRRTCRAQRRQLPQQRRWRRRPRRTVQPPRCTRRSRCATSPPPPTARTAAARCAALRIQPMPAATLASRHSSRPPLQHVQPASQPAWEIVNLWQYNQEQPPFRGSLSTDHDAHCCRAGGSPVARLPLGAAGPRHQRAARPASAR